MKQTKGLFIGFSIFLIIIGLLIFLTCWSIDTKTLIIQFAGIVVTGIGFVIAIYQLKLSTNQYLDDIKKKNKDYLDLMIETKYDNQYFSLKTQVINKSGDNKEIDFSFILITKQQDDIIEKIQSIKNYLKLDFSMPYSNDFNKLKNYITKPIFIENTIGIIPLEFYYSENIRIGNENPSYTFSFNRSELDLTNGIYSARFFIYPKNGYHRSTVDSLILK